MKKLSRGLKFLIVGLISAEGVVFSPASLQAFIFTQQEGYLEIPAEIKPSFTVPAPSLPLIETPEAQTLAEGFFTLALYVNLTPCLFFDTDELLQDVQSFIEQGLPLEFALVEASKYQGVLSGIFQIPQNGQLEPFIPDSNKEKSSVTPILLKHPTEGWVLVTNRWIERRPLPIWLFPGEEHIQYYPISSGRSKEIKTSELWELGWDGRVIALNGPIHKLV